MKISKLCIRQFRNITDLSFSPHPILNMFIGDNGQGKTSLIEAIYYLSTLRSFRTGKSSDLIELGHSGFFLQADLEEKSFAFDLKLRLEDKKRKLTLSEKPISVSHFTGKLRAVVFSPESLSAIKSGPEFRRDLIDQAIFQISSFAAEAQRSFSRALKQRNACLRQIRDGEMAANQGEAILESLEPFFIQSAGEVIEQRLIFLEKIFGKVEKILQQITGEKNVVSYTYKSSQGCWELRQLNEIKDRLRGELNSPARHGAERLSGVTLTGPHRHDINFLFNGNDSRIFCSQGQQRAVILAFKIAEIVYHNEAFESYPILLLDDVLSEFDEGKRNFLIDFLRKSEAQTFLTTTEPIQNLQGSTVFQVRAGNISSKQ